MGFIKTLPALIVTIALFSGPLRAQNTPTPQPMRLATIEAVGPGCVSAKRQPILQLRHRHGWREFV
jgi:hypothetical protein